MDMAVMCKSSYQRGILPLVHSCPAAQLNRQPCAIRFTAPARVSTKGVCTDSTVPSPPQPRGSQSPRLTSTSASAPLAWQSGKVLQLAETRNQVQLHLDAPASLA